MFKCVYISIRKQPQVIDFSSWFLYKLYIKLRKV